MSYYSGFGKNIDPALFIKVQGKFVDCSQNLYTSIMDTLQTIRKQIDDIDNNIITLFSKRFSLVKKLGKIKKEEHMPILDAKREEEKIQILITKGKELPEKFIRDMWQRIFLESYTIES